MRSTGFYRNKATSIRETARRIVEQFGGRVPDTLDDLVSLRGVARKTANLVLGTAMGIPSGIVVDTHVGRVARRLGLTDHDDPEKVERDLCAAIPRSEWVDGGHRLLLHGRYVCLAKAPQGVGCPLAELCPPREAEPSGTVAARSAAVAAGFAERISSG